MLGLPPSLPPPPLSRSVPLLSLEGLEPGACALEARDTLDMAHPFSIISGHAEQDRTHAYTHTQRDTHTTHRQLPQTCLITSTCCLSSLLTAWASAPKFQAIVCISGVNRSAH